MGFSKRDSLPLFIGPICFYMYFLFSLLLLELMDVVFPILEKFYFLLALFV